MLTTALELVGPRWRNHVGIIIVYFWSFGYMLTPAIAYFFRDWRILQLVITLLMLVYIPYYWYGTITLVSFSRSPITGGLILSYTISN